MPDIFISARKILPLTHGHRVDIGIFSSFWQHPDHQSILDKEEAVLLVLRRHFITNFPWVLMTVLLLAFPASLFLISSVFGAKIIDLPQNFTIILIVFYALTIFGYSFMQFLDWYFNITFLTQKRIIDIDFANLVFHDLAETKFTFIQDVNYTQSGFLQSVFDFGDVFAQTAGEKENFEALRVPSPGEVTRLIAQLMGQKND